MLEQSARQVVGYFASHLKNDGAPFGENAADIACYFKLPMMFIFADMPDKAKLTLQHIQKTFMTPEGDFKTAENLKSIKPEYSEFWTYANGWIIRAAQKTGQREITKRAYQYFNQYQHQSGNYPYGFLTHQPEARDGITDILTTAHHGLINLERENIAIAKTAGDYLCEALDKQQHLKTNGLYLRINASGELIQNFPQELATLHLIDKNKPDQLYFMAGYPCAYLGILYQFTQDKKYFTAAKAYMDFALSCHENIFQSNFSHKIAWASAILYEITQDEKYLAIIKKITDYFIGIQDKSGLWFQEAGVETSYDQSAEIACWFLDIACRLEK